MVFLGVILLILGLLFGFGLLVTLGILIIIIGLVFWALGAAGHAIGGRRRWY